METANARSHTLHIKVLCPTSVPYFLLFPAADDDDDDILFYCNITVDCISVLFKLNFWIL